MSYAGPERRTIERCRTEFPTDTAWGVSRRYRCTLPKGHEGAHRNEDTLEEARRKAKASTPPTPAIAPAEPSHADARREETGEREASSALRMEVAAIMDEARAKWMDSALPGLRDPFLVYAGPFADRILRALRAHDARPRGESPFPRPAEVRCNEYRHDRQPDADWWTVDDADGRTLTEWLPEADARFIVAAINAYSPEASSEQVGGTAAVEEMRAVDSAAPEFRTDEGEETREVRDALADLARFVRQGADCLLCGRPLGKTHDDMCAFGVVSMHVLLTTHGMAGGSAEGAPGEIRYIRCQPRPIAAGRTIGDAASQPASATPTPANAPSEPSHADVPREEARILAEWAQGQADGEALIDLSDRRERKMFYAIAAALRARTQPQEQGEPDLVAGLNNSKSPAGARP